MKSAFPIAARLRLALVCAALAVGGGALPAGALVFAPATTQIALVAGRRPTGPCRERRPAPPPPPSARAARRTPGVTSPPPRRPPPRRYLLHRALLR